MTWLQIQGPNKHAYDRAMRRAAKRLSEELAPWWAETGRRRLLVQQTKQDAGPWRFEDRDGDLFVVARVDLSILDGDASQQDAEDAAQANLKIIIDQVANHVGLEPYF